ncbi:YggS family pyridoxal phosphate-dependent enzyme [Lederbergia sp. NSJ-179]|uniref:YggS family pyridoxal phosphate-dependent enzyme n=1 Tax=Lederbergia sp. NSJ-179 TaxID=2931402 RepID=UPI001FD28552|nr:YggS family pyridoxal phosphate-dependent enzyme [Lederbergia sp. NSJ-179]MCJ7839564.1 YggS family pyridoxal phosphate-dependent enzyme [Lederbergia sp. NSJ-179]
MKVENNFAIIKEKIAAACSKVGRNPKDVNVIAVTKYVSNERALEAVDAGIQHLGENRDDGLLSKWEILGNRPVWHFIGTLQTRKVKNILDKVSYIHSLDRHSLAKEIDKRATSPMKCFVQVNMSGEESKHGVQPEVAIEFIKELERYSNIQIVGLMTMAPLTQDKQVIRHCFRKLKALQDEIRRLHLPHAPCTELSMGMSNDYQIAVEEGATYVRIGTALVGE